MWAGSSTLPDTYTRARRSLKFKFKGATISAVVRSAVSSAPCSREPEPRPSASEGALPGIGLAACQGPLHAHGLQGAELRRVERAQPGGPPGVIQAEHGGRAPPAHVRLCQRPGAPSLPHLPQPQEHQESTPGQSVLSRPVTLNLDCDARLTSFALCGRSRCCVFHAEPA
jgi:hypothetical protein